MTAPLPAMTAHCLSGSIIVAMQAIRKLADRGPLPPLAAASRAGSMPRGTLVSLSARKDIMNSEAWSSFICMRQGGFRYQQASAGSVVRKCRQEDGLSICHPLCQLSRWRRQGCKDCAAPMLACSARNHWPSSTQPLKAQAGMEAMGWAASLTLACALVNCASRDRLSTGICA